MPRGRREYPRRRGPLAWPKRPALGRVGRKRDCGRGRDRSFFRGPSTSCALYAAPQTCCNSALVGQHPSAIRVQDPEELELDRCEMDLATLATSRTRVPQGQIFEDDRGRGQAQIPAVERLRHCAGRIHLEPRAMQHDPQSVQALRLGVAQQDPSPIAHCPMAVNGRRRARTRASAGFWRAHRAGQESRPANFPRRPAESFGWRALAPGQLVGAPQKPGVDLGSLLFRVERRHIRPERGSATRATFARPRAIRIVHSSTLPTPVDIRLNQLVHQPLSAQHVDRISPHVEPARSVSWRPRPVRTFGASAERNTSRSERRTGQRRGPALRGGREVGVSCWSTRRNRRARVGIRSKWRFRRGRSTRLPFVLISSLPV